MSVPPSRGASKAFCVGQHLAVDVGVVSWPKCRMRVRQVHVACPNLVRVLHPVGIRSVGAGLRLAFRWLFVIESQTQGICHLVCHGIEFRITHFSDGLTRFCKDLLGLVRLVYRRFAVLWLGHQRRRRPEVSSPKTVAANSEKKTT